MKLDDIVKDLDSNKEKGLTSEQVLKSREKTGYNVLKEGKKQHIIVKFLAQFKDLLIIILIIAAIVSVIIDPHEYVESIIIFGVVLLNAILGVTQESKAEKALEALKKMSQPTCKVIRDSKIEVINSSDVVVGDIILVEAGDVISADARIIECSELKVDESSLTGESLPVSKHANELTEENLPLGDQKNMLFSSTFVTNGKAKAIVTSVGMSTEIGKIATLLTNTQSEDTPLQNKLTQVGKIIAIMCLAICALVFAFEVISGYLHKSSPDYAVNGVFKEYLIWVNAFKSAVALAVAAIPEGLAAVVTIVLSIGVQKMAKRNAIVKKLPAVETLGSCNVICSDKTGTLTQNKMTVVKLYNSNIKSLENINDDEKKLLTYLAVCCDAQVDKETGKRVGDPTELALIDAAHNNDLDFYKYEKVLDLPFDSERKMMTTVIQVDNKFLAITKGGPDIVISRCTDSKEILDNALDANKTMANDALRVLALAIKEFDKIPNKEQLETNMNFIGLVGMIDPARPEVKESIRLAKEANIKTVMITGDHITTASAIAKELGILEDGKKAITSVELDKISDEELARTIDDYRVFARVAPKDKLRIVDAWQKQDAVVAMTGDGVNDAPALKGSDIGCAMGITGTDVSKQAADMILTDDNFSTIVEAVKQGRGIYANIKRCVRFLLSSNIGEVVTIFLVSLIGICFPKIELGIPLLAIHLLWINLITDSLPAFALGLENADDSLMKEKPRHKKESFFAGKLGVNIFFEGLIIGLLTITAYFLGFFVLSNNGEHNAELGHTMAFMTLATAELFHAYNMKTDKSLFSKKTFNNKWLNMAFILGLALQFIVLYVPGINTMFQLYPLEIHEVGIVFGLAISTIVFMEIYKAIYHAVKKNK